MKFNFKNFLISSGLFFVSCFFAFCLLELSVRLLNLNQVGKTVWSDRPDEYYVSSNAKNMQDHEHDPNSKDTFRIAVVGDSFSFAPYLQADDTFIKRLERWMNISSNQKIEVINYGVPRYSTSHEVDVVKKAIEEHADLILLQITLNDPEIKPYRPTALIADNRFAQDIKDSWWTSNFKIIKFIQQRIYNYKSIQEYKNYFLDLWNGKKTYKNFFSSLKKINKLANDANVPIKAVVFPLFGFPNDENYPFHSIHEKVKTSLDQEKIANLDLFASFQNLPLDRMVVLPGKDRHPNEIANRIAAESIYQWLKPDLKQLY